MATDIAVKVTGGIKTFLCEQFQTVAEVKAKLNLEKHTAQVNGEDADDNFELEDNDYVILSQPVKGGY